MMLHVLAKATVQAFFDDSLWLDGDSEMLKDYAPIVGDLPMIQNKLQAVGSVRGFAAIGHRSRRMTLEPQKTTQQKKKKGSSMSVSSIGRSLLAPVEPVALTISRRFTTETSSTGTVSCKTADGSS